MKRTRLLQTGIITALQSKEFRPLSRSRARMFSQGTKMHNRILDFFFFFYTTWFWTEQARLPFSSLTADIHTGTYRKPASYAGKASRCHPTLVLCPWGCFLMESMLPCI